MVKGLLIDTQIVEDEAMGKWTRAYAEDQFLWFDHYTKAQIKMSELGCVNLRSVWHNRTKFYLCFLKWQFNILTIL